ncbi:hypothetical protein BDV11DRAFT_186285 [Aspergillus similis]
MFEHPSCDHLSSSQSIQRTQATRFMKPLSGPESNETMTVSRQIMFSLVLGRPNNVPYHQMPGVRCPKCQSAGKETWVIPGKYCHVCGTAC